MEPESPPQFGKRPIDDSTGFEVDGLIRFRQKFEMFNRSAWDGEVQSPKVQKFFESYFTDRAEFRTAEGYGHRDFALRNASWYVADFTADMFEESGDRKEGFLDSYTMLRPGATVKVDVADVGAITKDLKKAALFLGADLVGICAYDERWIYSHNFSRRENREKPIDLPTDLPFVVVIANEMHAETLNTVPSALSGAATGQGYSKDIIAALSLASYIQNLGYRAVATLNDTALSIPLAIQAGLGENGRHGLLITKEYGPRVRIAKVFTDLPLVPDAPISFGVRQFCEVCGKCAKGCPPKAIPFGPPDDGGMTISNLVGVRKWTINPEKCFKFWTNQGTDCAICIRVCPYNKDFRKPLYRMGRWLAGTRLRRAMVWLDDRLGFGKRKSPNAWWKA